jgi:hypothetical protein
LCTKIAGFVCETQESDGNRAQEKARTSRAAHYIRIQHPGVEPVRSGDDREARERWRFADAVVKRGEIGDIFLLGVAPMLVLVRIEIQLPEARYALATYCKTKSDG